MTEAPDGMPDRVVVVGDYATVNGGAARVGILGARGLAEAGVPVTFLCAVGEPAPELDHPNITLRHLGLADVRERRGALAAAAQGVWNDAARRALGAVLRDADEGRTVVHLHQWTRALSPSVFATLRGRTWAVSLHDYFLLCPNGAYYLFPEGRPCAVRPMSAACVRTACDAQSRGHKAVRLVRQTVTASLLDRRAAPLNLIHVSDLARDAMRPFAPAGSRHFVVPNPCLAPKGPAAPVAENRTFLFLGRLTEEKGALDFARAARQAGVPALFVGAGPETDRVRALCPGAEVRPWAGEREVFAAIDAARAVVLPSRWYETFGLTVLEARSRGVPAIVARTTGAAEGVASSGAGLVVEAGDVDGLAGALRRLADDDAFAAACGGRAHAAFDPDTHGVRAHARRLLEVYAALPGGRAAEAA